MYVYSSAEESLPLHNGRGPKKSSATRWLADPPWGMVHLGGLVVCFLGFIFCVVKILKIFLPF